MQDVGKLGWVWGVVGGISKIPDWHSPDLGKRTTSQTYRYKVLALVFHFSGVNYGYYCLN